MSELAPVAGTPRKVKIGGKEYTVTPLDIDDLAEFEVEVKEIRNRLVTKSLKESGLRVELIAEKIIQVSSKPLSVDDLNEAMATMSGTRFLLWCALRKNHPQFKLDKMGSLINLDNFKEARKIVSKLGGKAIKKRKNLTRGPQK